MSAVKESDTYRGPVTWQTRKEALALIQKAEETIRQAKRVVCPTANLKDDQRAVKLMAVAKGQMKDASWYLRGCPTRFGGRA